jgi:hypothetical protein
MIVLIETIDDLYGHAQPQELVVAGTTKSEDGEHAGDNMCRSDPVHPAAWRPLAGDLNGVTDVARR